METPLHQHHTEGRPGEEKNAKCDGDEPVQRRKVVGAAEHDVKRRRVDDEHAKTRAREDPRKVVRVPQDLPAEGERELGFDGKDLATFDVSAM